VALGVAVVVGDVDQLVEELRPQPARLADVLDRLHARA
jgi:hypothetical protein